MCVGGGRGLYLSNWHLQKLFGNSCWEGEGGRDSSHYFRSLVVALSLTLTCSMAVSWPGHGGQTAAQSSDCPCPSGSRQLEHENIQLETQDKKLRNKRTK